MYAGITMKFTANSSGTLSGLFFRKASQAEGKSIFVDKIDVFAMRYLDNTKIPCKYLVVELKKDTAEKSTIDQIMKYVDWVCSEYAFGDYGMIEACIVAADYAEGINDYYDNVVQRLYTLGSHPVRNRYWNSLRLLKYVCDNNKIKYEDITPKVGFSLHIKN